VTTIPYVQPDHFRPLFAKGWYPVGEAIVLIFWSFFGWEAICNLVDRFERPERDMVRSALISAAITGTLFMGLSIMTIGSGTYGSMETDSAPLGIMLNRSLGLTAQYVTTFLTFVICTGTVNAFVASLAQLGYALSRDRAFPAWLYFQHPRTGTPTRVVWLVILFACAGVLFSTLFHVHFTQLLFIPNSLGMIVYVLSMAAAVKLYKRFSLPWLSGLVSLVMLCVFIPFLGIHFMLPISVSILYILYKRKTMSGKIVTRRNETRGGSGHADAT